MKKPTSPVTAPVTLEMLEERLAIAANRAARATGQAWWTDAIGQEHAAARAAYDAPKAHGFRTGV